MNVFFSPNSQKIAPATKRDKWLKVIFIFLFILTIPTALLLRNFSENFHFILFILTASFVNGVIGYMIGVLLDIVYIATGFPKNWIK